MSNVIEGKQKCCASQFLPLKSQKGNMRAAPATFPQVNVHKWVSILGTIRRKADPVGQLLRGPIESRIHVTVVLRWCLNVLMAMAKLPWQFVLIRWGNVARCLTVITCLVCVDGSSCDSNTNDRWRM